MVEPIDQEDTVVFVDRHAGRSVELARPRAEGTPASCVTAVRLEDLDVVTVLVGDVDPAPTVGRDPDRPDELTLAGPERPELAQVLLVDGAHADPQRVLSPHRVR